MTLPPMASAAGRVRVLPRPDVLLDPLQAFQHLDDLLAHGAVRRVVRAQEQLAVVLGGVLRIRTAPVRTAAQHTARSYRRRSVESTPAGARVPWRRPRSTPRWRSTPPASAPGPGGTAGRPRPTVPSLAARCSGRCRPRGSCSSWPVWIITRARCYSSLKFLVTIGILHIKEIGEGELQKALV